MSQEIKGLGDYQIINRTGQDRPIAAVPLNDVEFLSAMVRQLVFYRNLQEVGATSVIEDVTEVKVPKLVASLGDCSNPESPMLLLSYEPRRNLSGLERNPAFHVSSQVPRKRVDQNGGWDPAARIEISFPGRGYYPQEEQVNNLVTVSWKPEGLLEIIGDQPVYRDVLQDGQKLDRWNFRKGLIEAIKRPQIIRVTGV